MEQLQLDFDAFHHGPATLGEAQFRTSGASDSTRMVDLPENYSNLNHKQNYTKLNDLMYGLNRNTVQPRDKGLAQVISHILSFSYIT